MIPTTDDSEEALFSPIRVPTVGHNPVATAKNAPDGRVEAPAHQLDGMTALWNDLPQMLVVDARLVVHEAPVHLETNLDWAIHEEVFLHVVHPIDGIGGARLGPCEGFVVPAGAPALRSGAQASCIGIASIGD